MEMFLWGLWLCACWGYVAGLAGLMWLPMDGDRGLVTVATTLGGVGGFHDAPPPPCSDAWVVPYMWNDPYMLLPVVW